MELRLFEIDPFPYLSWCWSFFLKGHGLIVCLWLWFFVNVLYDVHSRNTAFTFLNSYLQNLFIVSFKKKIWSFNKMKINMDKISSWYGAFAVHLRLHRFLVVNCEECHCQVYLLDCIFGLLHVTLIEYGKNQKKYGYWFVGCHY